MSNLKKSHKNSLKAVDKNLIEFANKYEKRLNRHDLVMISLTTQPGSYFTSIKLGLCVFCLQKIFGNNLRGDAWEFKPSRYGPVCEEMFLDIEVIPDMIRISTVEGNNFAEYSATMNTYAYVKTLDLDSGVLGVIDSMVRWILYSPILLLLEVIERENPEFFKVEDKEL
jgi:hypothetical protein